MLATAEGRYEQAEALIARSLTLAPDNVEAWFRKGEVLREQGADNNALAAYASL